MGYPKGDTGSLDSSSYTQGNPRALHRSGGDVRHAWHRLKVEGLGVGMWDLGIWGSGFGV